MAIKIALVMEKEKLVNFLPYLGLGFIWSKYDRSLHVPVFSDV